MFPNITMAPRRKIPCAHYNNMFKSYGFNANELLVFKDELIKVTNPISQRSYFYIMCTRNGELSWLNLNVFFQFDAYMRPIYPQWFSLASLREVYKKLMEMKTLQCGETFVRYVHKVTKNGHIKRKCIRTNHGKIKMRNGHRIMIQATFPRKFVSIQNPI